MVRRKRKTDKASAMAANEVKTSKAYLGTTTPTDNSSAVEDISIENNAQPNSNGVPSQKKKPRITITNKVVRRSGRLRSSALSGRAQWPKVKPVVEHVILDDNEKEEEEEEEEAQTENVNTANKPVVNEEENLEVETEPQVQQVSARPDTSGRSLEEKVNYLVRAVDEFKPKVIGRPNEGPSSDFSYKSLYIQLQKKYDNLMEEHYELVRKLEFARGQIAAYEKMNDTMGALKEVIFVSGLGKGTEANVNLSPQMVQNRMPSPSPVATAAVTVTDAGADSPKQKRKYNKRKTK